MRDRQLRHADRVCEVDVEECIATTGRVVPRRARGGAGWVPEIREGRLVDACARADDVDAAEVLVCGVEETGELRPVCHVCLPEDGSRTAGSVGIDDFLGLGTER